MVYPTCLHVPDDSRLAVLYVTACGEAGVADYVRFNAGAVSATGVRVGVAGPSSSRLAIDVSRLAGVEFFGLPIHKAPSPLSDLRCARVLRRTIARNGFHVVHSNSPKAGFITALAAAGMKRTKLVYSPHCTSAKLKGVSRLAPLFFACERWAARRHDLLLTGCMAECRELILSGMARNQRATFVYYGIDTAGKPVRSNRYRGPMGLGDSDVLLGTVARLVHQKGIDYLIPAFAELARAFPRIRLAIAGDGPLEAGLKALARSYGVAERISFLGYVDDCDSFLADLDIFVLPSRWDAFPLAMLRAAIAGIPVVVSDVGGVSEIVDRDTGWLVPVGDVEALVAAFSTVLSNRAEALERADRLRARVMAHCDLTTNAARILEIYRDLVSGAPYAVCQAQDATSR